MNIHHDNRLMTRYGADERRYAEASHYPEWTLARVISQSRELYRVVTEVGEQLAKVSGRLRYEAGEPAFFPAVGDFALMDGDVIQQVLSRRSAFERTAVGNRHQAQVVASNIDIAFVCMSLNQNYRLSRLERYLSVAWNSGALPVVVLTKADLCDDLPAILAEVDTIASGAKVIATSAADPTTRERLVAFLREGVTAAFLGSSGVGKSTLINLLLGEERLQTSAIGQMDKGRHTTTRRELLLLPGGGAVIDTPGMRELGVEAADLSRSFADIDKLMASCRFSDCTHTSEPGCAVRKALETGTLDARRLESYRKLQREAKYEGLSARNRENEKLNGMFEEVGGMKNARKFLRQRDKRNQWS